MSEKSSTRKIQTAILRFAAGAFIVIGMAIGLVTSWPLYSEMKRHGEANLMREVADKKVAIQAFLDGAKDSAMQVTSRTVIREKLEAYYAGKVTRGELAAFTETKLLDAMRRSSLIAGISRLDRNGNLVVLAGVPIPRNFWVIPRDGLRVADIGPLFADDGKTFLVVGAPVLDRALKRVATDIILVDLSRLKSIVENPSNLGTSEEVFLATGNPKNPSLIFGGSSVSKSQFLAPLGDSLVNKALEKAFLQESGMLDHVNSESQPYMVAYAPIAGTKWGLAIRVSKHEFDGPIWKQFLLSGAFIIVAVLMGTLGMIFVIRPLTGKLIFRAADLEKEIRAKTGQLYEELAQRKQAEEALRESEERYRIFFDTSRDCVFMTRLDGRFIDFNDVALEVFGYVPGERDELLQTNVASFYANTEEREAHVKLVSKQGFSKEYPLDLRKRDGTIIHALITTVARKDPNGNIVGFQGTVRDITERKKTDEALRESEDRYRQITENSLTGIYINQDEVCVYVNLRMAEILGYAKEEMIGRRLVEAVRPSDREMVLERTKARLSGELSPTAYELRLVKKTGEEIWCEILATVVDYRGRPALMGNVADVTGRKKAEEEREILRTQLLQAQKMEAIGTLTGGIAHDFNNLLTIINGFTEVILSEKTEDDPYSADLQKIMEAGRKGAELVQRLLALSKKGESDPQPLDLNRAVENSISLIRGTFPKIFEIETIFEKDLGMVNADSAQVEQVLMNLFINAKEAMPEGGRLRIETKNMIVDEAHCKRHVGAKPGPHVLIEVLDTGVGMDADTLRRIFDPFFTTKGWDFKKGTGLGLSVAKGIVEQHGGWITFQSEPGKGTTFTMYFPAIVEEPVAERPKPLTETVSRGEKILLVDNEELVRDLGKRILERSGYTVITASNGKEALEIYAREQSNIGLVVLDLIMPQMGGEKCLEELVKINPYVKVVVSSGHSLAPKEWDHLGTYAKGFVNKPYQLKEFLKVVREVIDAG